MRSAPARRRLAAGLTAAATALTVLTFAAPASGTSGVDAFPPTPQVPCDAGSLEESTQGRVPLAEVESGRAAKGYSCNARELSHFGVTGGFRVESYVDKAGNICAYYDTTLLFPKDTLNAGIEGTGVYVMDMKDPAKPVHVTTLRTAAMQSPHETLRLNKKRGLLAAALSYPTFNPGFIDIYDVSEDCRAPVLKSSTPLGVLGHESGWAPDGNTFYVGSLYGRTLAAVDVTNPMVPSLLYVSKDYQPHGMSISDDGNRMYMAEASQAAGAYDGLTILDVSQIQKRTLNPSVPVVSRTTWPNVGTPQTTEPFTLNGRPYLMETDEYGSGAKVGAGRIIDLSDEKKPVVISNLRLQVNQEKDQAGEQNADPGASEQFQGYEAHYCTIPTRVNPTVVACTFIVSGFRLFDISNPRKPQEIAYFNGKILPDDNPLRQGAFAMAAPAFSPRANEYWYSDGNLGFYVVQTTAAARRSPALDGAGTPPRRPANAPAAGGGGAPAGSSPAAETLPTTGLPLLLPVLALTFLAGYGLTRRRRART